MSVGLADDPRARFWQLWAGLRGPHCRESSAARQAVFDAAATQVIRLRESKWQLGHEHLLSDFELKFRVATGDPSCRKG